MKGFDKFLIGIVLGVLVLVGVVVFTVALLRLGPAGKREQTSEPRVRFEEPIILTTQIIVALQPIPQGSEFVAGSIGRRDWPVNNIPPGIIADEAETIGMVAAVDIVQDQIIMRDMLTTERERGAASWHNQGLQYAEQENYQEAIEAFSEVINALKPDLAETYFQRGLIYHRLGDYEQAVADYNKAIESNPELVGAYRKLAHVYYELGDYEQSIANCNRVIELAPDDTEAYVMRGIGYYSSGDSEQAFQDFDTYLETDPNPARAYNNVAWALAYTLDTNYEQALEFALRSVELDSYSYNQDTLALVYYKLEQYEKALEHYSIALSLNNENLTSYKGRGDVYLALGNKEAALTDYQTYLTLAVPGPERTAVEDIIKSLQQP